MILRDNALAPFCRQCRALPAEKEPVIKAFPILQPRSRCSASTDLQELINISLNQAIHSFYPRRSPAGRNEFEHSCCPNLQLHIKQMHLIRHLRSTMTEASKWQNPYLTFSSCAFSAATRSILPGVNGISTGASLRDNAVDQPDFYQDVNVMRSTSWDKVGFVIPPVPGDSQPARASRFTPSAFAYRPCSGQAPRPQHLEEEYL
jgi:hypothetical protein